MSIADYIRLAVNQKRFLAFGFLLTFMSSAGQTYFIGIFGPGIRETFSISHTQWGTIYLAGTLGSALVLPWSGQFIDRLDLQRYTLLVLAGLITACLAIAGAQSVLMVVLAIFLLRQFGQGLTSHTSITSMARYIFNDRGKAIAIASMGFSTGEALLPVIAVISIGLLGWRQTYLVTALLLLLLIPFAMWLLGGHHQRHQRHLEQKNSAATTRSRRDHTRAEVLRDFRFYLLLPAVLAPSTILTGLFFHHLTLAELKGWSGIWITGSYWIYALTTVITSLLTGPLIDRLSAARVVPYYLVPLALALLLLAPVENRIWVAPYMLLIGINTGYYFTGITALWPELYGATHLGAIKSLIGALGVFASALGPVSIGYLLDRGVSLEAICVLFAASCLGATALMTIGLKLYRRAEVETDFSG